MPKIVELRQDRSFVRSNFDGYKLSLDAIPLLRHELTTAPNKAELTDEQYSLLHAQLFSMQNLLHVDPWERNISYFVNSKGEIVRSHYNENTGRPESLQVVYRISPIDRRIKGDYNYSLSLISEKYCVLCDGINQLQLVDTGDRRKSVEWKFLAGTTISADERNFMLFDSRLDIINEKKQISCALGRVIRKDIANGGCSHFLQLHWTKWLHDAESDSWIFKIEETLEGKGSLYYCAFEPRAESLIISSNREFNFKSKIPAETNINNDVKQAQLHDDSIEVKGFTWTQSDDDIIIKFDIREGKDKTDYNVKCTTKHLTVKCNEEILLDKELIANVDQDLTTWSIENNFLQITLIKEISTQFWSSLLKEGAGPKESQSTNNTSCLPVEQQPIANLEAPVEDCDFPIGTAEDEIKIVRLNLASKCITHSILLGSTPPLFSTILRPGFPAAFATRQDVDACLWLQQYNPGKADEWSMRHEGNLHAFGYVQASKQQKKFIDCSPDLNYAVICESHRHLFLYKSNYDTANGLRYRAGPQVTIGKQHLITLEDTGEVLGLVTAQNVITLLTEKCILYLQINS